MARENEKKSVMSAKARGLKGAVIGAIIMAVFILIFDISMANAGNPVPVSEKSRYLGMMAVAPLYGFGYAFGYKKMIAWFAKALHFSGEVTMAALIWWVLTGSKKGFIRGFTIIMIVFCAIAGAAWMPGIPMGIRAIREENREMVKRGAEAVLPGKKERPKLLDKAREVKERSSKKPYSGASQGVSADPETNRLMRELSEEQARERAAKVLPGAAAAASAVSAARLPLAGSRLQCFGGDYAGASFDLSDGKDLVIGRDPGRSQIVLPGSGVSRAHCIVRYSAKDGCALVKDISSNGTMLLDGTPVPRDRFMKVQGGNGIRIGKDGPVFLFS